MERKHEKESAINLLYGRQLKKRKKKMQKGDGAVIV